VKRLGTSEAIVRFSRFKIFIVCCAVSFLIPIAACVGFNLTDWALILLRAPDFLVLLLWLASAIGIGSVILKLTGLDRALDGLLRIVTATAIGLGLISLSVLLIGLRVHIGACIAWSILAIGLAAGAWARDVWLIFPSDQLPADSTQCPFRWLLLLCAAALGMACVAALVPPGILWGDEPNGYDVVEYHLQVPREWYELGRIVPLRHNVFSYFPFNVEMHFLLAMGLRGGPWAGMYLAQLMHVALIALTVLSVYALISQRSKSMAIISATAMATVPWMGLLAPVGYDEGGLLLWGTLAIGLSVRDPQDWRSMALAGAMAGFACGSKLTAVPIVLLATPGIHVCLARFKPKAIVAGGTFVLTGSLIFSPWLIKNIAWVGNPIFPEEATLLGGGHWSQTQVQRWINANHLPRSDQQNLHGRMAAGWDQILKDWRYGYLLIPLAIISAGLSWKQRQTAALLLILIVLTGFWLFFTHLQSRFFTLAIPLAALLIGQIEARGNISIAYGIVVSLAALGGLIAVYQKVTSINSHLFELIGVERLMGLTPLADITLPPDARVLLIGDGKPFLYNVPTDRLRYRTVFDVDAKPGETSDQAWESGWDASNGPTVRVIDAPELRRFADTYWGIPEPSASVMQMPEPTVKQ
jgi:hypothetical protein